MQFGPGQDKVLLRSGHRTGQQRRRHNGKRSPMFAVTGVKVRQLMTAKLIIHRNDDPIKTRYFRQARPPVKVDDIPA